MKVLYTTPATYDQVSTMLHNCVSRHAIRKHWQREDGWTKHNSYFVQPFTPEGVGKRMEGAFNEGKFKAFYQVSLVNGFQEESIVIDYLLNYFVGVWNGRHSKVVRAAFTMSGINKTVYSFSEINFMEVIPIIYSNDWEEGEAELEVQHTQTEATRKTSKLMNVFLSCFQQKPKINKW